MAAMQKDEGSAQAIDVGAERSIILHVENALFRQFLEEKLAAEGRAFCSVDRAALAEAISQAPDGALILQSDSDEFGLIEIAARLKRLFADRFRIVFLSVDYKIASHTDGVVDAFVQFPVAISELLDVADARNDASRRVLLIDDSRLVHSSIVGPLVEAGFEVFQAFDGQEGVELARQLRPRLIICDIEMPRLNGFEACAAIRKSPECADAHIIMSSTLGSAADQQRGFEAGVDEYITKPVVIDELIERLERALRHSSAGRENILILEKDEKLGKNIVKALKSHGFRAHHVSSIRDALRALNRISCDLVVSEINCSDGNIIDLFNGLRGLSPDRQPDVITMSTRDNSVDARMVANAGASGFLNKPFSADSLLAMVERSLAERRAQRERVQLQRYVSKASVRMALEKSVMSGDAAAARADLKTATIFFSDIVNFTSRCERYAPRDVVEQVNTLFDVMTRVIMKSDGDIDKFMGDACMAFWLDDGRGSSTKKAVDSVLAMRHALRQMNETSQRLSADPIAIRIGINTGDVILCDIGAVEARVDLTIISDAVNVAARFESASKQYGVDNLISELTLAPIKDYYATRIIDRVRVKGKSSAVGCYELFDFIGSVSARDKELIGTFECGFQEYSNGNFEAALRKFNESAQLESVGLSASVNPSRLYMNRCRQLLEVEPKDWDGVWSLSEK